MARFVAKTAEAFAAAAVRGMQQQCAVNDDQVEKPANSVDLMNSSRAHSSTRDGMSSGVAAS